MERQISAYWNWSVLCRHRCQPQGRRNAERRPEAGIYKTLVSVLVCFDPQMVNECLILEEQLPLDLHVNVAH
jgi:hypothetical protein